MRLSIASTLSLMVSRNLMSPRFPVAMVAARRGFPSLFSYISPISLSPMSPRMDLSISPMYSRLSPRSRMNFTPSSILMLAIILDASLLVPITSAR